MFRAKNLSVSRFRQNFKGDIPVSEDKAGMGVEFVAPIVNRGVLFCSRSSFSSWEWLADP